MQKLLHFGKTGRCSDNVRSVCAAASLHVNDPFFDRDWSFRPPVKRRKRRTQQVRSINVEKLIAHLLK